VLEVLTAVFLRVRVLLNNTESSEMCQMLRRRSVPSKRREPSAWSYILKVRRCHETSGITRPTIQRHSTRDANLCVFNEVQLIDELQTLPFLVKYTFYISYWKFAKTSHSNRHLPHRTPKLFSYCHCLCFHRQFQARYCHWTSDIWAIWLWMELIFSFESAGIELDI